MTSKNILLIGPTGSGKSTLGNVLINRNENFEKVFEESEWTKETKIEEVEIEGTKYRVIDTVGWNWGGDESEQQILTELAQVFQAAEGKIDRILLLMKGRGNWKHVVAAFDSLKELDCKLLKHITIVWSNFFEFEEQEECEGNTSNLRDPRKANPKIEEIVDFLPIIYVNNPWINTSISKRKDETEEEFKARKKRKEEAQEVDKETRKSSRQVVLNHLKARCQETYQLEMKNLEESLKSYIITDKETKSTEETNKGGNNNKSGLTTILTFSFFVVTIVAIVVTGYRWLTNKKKGIVKKIILGILCLVALVFVGRMASNYYYYGAIQGKKSPGEELAELREQLTQIRRDKERKNNKLKEFWDTRTPCQKYLSEISESSGKLMFHLLYNNWTPNWDEINQKLQQFPPEEVKEGLEKMIKNIRDSSYFEYNKEQTIEELEKIIERSKQR